MQFQRYSYYLEIRMTKSIAKCSSNCQYYFGESHQKILFHLIVLLVQFNIIHDEWITCVLCNKPMKN